MQEEEEMRSGTQCVAGYGNNKRGYAMRLGKHRKVTCPGMPKPAGGADKLRPAKRERPAKVLPTPVRAFLRNTSDTTAKKCPSTEKGTTPMPTIILAYPFPGAQLTAELNGAVA